MLGLGEGGGGGALGRPEVTAHSCHRRSGGLRATPAVRYRIRLGRSRVRSTTPFMPAAGARRG